MDILPPDWFKWSQDKRNAEAKKLLAEAGYTADKPLTFNLLYNTCRRSLVACSYRQVSGPAPALYSP